MGGGKRALFFAGIVLGLSGFAGGAVKELPLPDVPAEMKAPGERAAYIMRHFWDGMDWGDTTMTRNEAFLEQNAVNFFSLFPHADSLAVSAAVDTLLVRCSADSVAVEILAGLAGQYLYERESPVWHEAGYEIMAREMLACAALPPEERLRIEARLEGLAKNRPGMPATDFGFVARDGSRSTLHETVGGTDKCVLVFYDPDCDNCNNLERQLAADRRISEAIANGALKVMLITPFAVDNPVWRRHAATLPETWVVGYSPEGAVDTGELYDLLSMPTLYLLSPSPVVHTRNATPKQIQLFVSDCE